MSAFKIKNDKVKQSVQISTLDEKHQQIMNNFQTKRSLLPNKKNKLKLLNGQLGKIELISPSKYTTEDIKKRASIKCEIAFLEDEIDDIENDFSELDYYFKTDDIIMEYYEITDNDDHIYYNNNPDLSNEKKLNSNTNSPSKLDLLNEINKKNKGSNFKVAKKRKKNVVCNNQINILDFLNMAGQNEEIVKADISETKIDSEVENKVEVIPTKNKAELLNQYMLMIDINSVQTKKQLYNIRKCQKCNIEKTLIACDGMIVCQQCGEMELVIIDSEKSNYKETSTDTKLVSAYKRNNHLNEWLSQFQAKESIDIPDEIYNKILGQLKKERITDMKKLNLLNMKKILKALQLTQYYEHTTFIISKLSGIPPPTISRETEEKIRLMFKQIQTPFDKYKPKIRTNFLSYSYVLHKFFQLLELDDFVKYFPLLKSREKLKKQDEIWEKICCDLNWSYYASI
jgi:hypothetical protein